MISCVSDVMRKSTMPRLLMIGKKHTPNTLNTLKDELALGDELARPADVTVAKELSDLKPWHRNTVHLAVHIDRSVLSSVQGNSI